MITDRKHKNEMRNSLDRPRKKSDTVIMEVVSDSERRHFIVPYDEWALIEQWYCNEDVSSDYLLKIRNGINSYRIIRLNKQVSELCVIKPSHSSIVSKNVYHILFSRVPGMIKFTVPFSIALLFWVLIGIVSIFKPVSVTQPAVKLTSIAFILFLLLNLQFAVFKGLAASKNKYEAFTSDNEEAITDTLIFNMGLLLLFLIIGIQNIINLFKSILTYMNIIA
ncbi:MAG: hypothetical protein ACOX7R_04760 [Acetivibrionales bacterium]|jgi:hypothetical protein